MHIKKIILSVGLLITAMVAIYLVYYYNLHPLLSYLLAINLTTMIFYLYDKAISPTHATRIPEQTLHILSLSGGSPAALISQKIFRHKSAKSSFLIIHYLIIFVQVAILAYLIYRDILFTT